jgi:hypothetical protein
MDNLKKKVGEMMEGKVDDQLQNANLPTSKDEAVQQLEEKGVPSQVTDKVRDLDTSQLPNVDDLKSKIGL